MPVLFQPRDLDSLPIEARGLLPEHFANATASELSNHRIFVGNRRHALGDLFTIEGAPCSEHWIFGADCPSLHHLGEGMSRGKIEVQGSVGRHVGSSMTGGRIEIAQDAGDWAGAEMQGGSLIIRGSAGHETGSSYRGSPRGMRGGSLLVWGNVGRETGRKMRRGLIAIGGSAGDLLGSSMLAGTIVVVGSIGKRTGAAMKRGTVITLTPGQSPDVPTFRPACEFQPPMIPLLMAELRQQSFPVPHSNSPHSFQIWNGDLLEGGRGELLIATTIPA